MKKCLLRAYSFHCLHFFNCLINKHNNMKKTLLIILSLAFCLALSAQEAKKFDKNRLEYGGCFGLSFASSKNQDYTSVIIMPEVGYRFSNMFRAGASVGYIYRSWDDYSENYAGLGLYARFRPIRYISLNVEPQGFQTWGSQFDSRFVGCLLLGGSVIIPMGSNMGISLSLSYDVIQDEYSPYRNGVVYGVGFSVGF